MSPFKEFVTAASAEKVEPIGEDIAFHVDGRQLTAMSPGPGQLSLLLASVGDTLSDQQSVATAINFLFSMLDDDDSRYLKLRLMDRDDPFGAEEIADILKYLIEEWSQNPTDAPSVSSSSRRRAGASSTATRRTAASTPSS